jgi:hypothetical protein
MHYTASSIKLTQQKNRQSLANWQFPSVSNAPDTNKIDPIDAISASGPKNSMAMLIN